MDLGKSLKYFRNKAGLKQEEVCEKVKIGITHLSQVEKNHKDPSLSLLKKLSGLYNMPLPIIWLFALGEEDIPRGEKYHFKILHSVIEILISNCFNLKKEDYNNIDPNDDMACCDSMHGKVYYKKRKDNIL